MVSKNSIVKLGILGFNEGNGHPYSFSAIINGYDPQEMSTCEFPVIYSYLEKREKSELGIDKLEVTHIWTPTLERSKKIAACCYIKNIVEDYYEMIGEVDAVIIARDDSDSHRELAKVFLENNIKVFIDKPLCRNIEDLRYFAPYLQKGEIFSTSGFRYHPDVNNLKSKRESLFIFNTFNDWYKYGVHVLEGAYAINNSRILTVENISTSVDDLVVFCCENGSRILISRTDSNNSFYGVLVDNDKVVKYNDNFHYFKKMLLDFEKFCLGIPTSFSYKETLNIIEALIKAQISKDKNLKIEVNEFGE